MPSPEEGNLIPEQQETTNQAEKVEAKKPQLTPETSRIVASSVGGRFLNPEEKVPEEKIEQFKDWVAHATPDKIKYQPLESLSVDSRKEYWQNKEGSFEDQKREWNEGTTHWIQNNIAENAENHEEVVETLKSLGVFGEENIEENLSDKVERYRQKYLDKESNIKQFVTDIADGCKDEEGHVDMDKLGSRLDAVKGLLHTFGNGESEIPTLIKDYATAHGLLSQNEEAKKTLADDVYEQTKEPMPDGPEKTRLTKLFNKQREIDNYQPTENEKSEFIQKSELQTRLSELTNPDNSDVLSQDEIKAIRKEINDLRAQQSSGTLSEEEYTQKRAELVSRLDKTRFLTDDLEQIKLFREIQGLPYEGIVAFFDGQAKEAKAEGKDLLFGFEFYRDENGKIHNKPSVVENTQPKIKTENPPASSEEQKQQSDEQSTAPAAPAEPEQQAPETDTAPTAPVEATSRQTKPDNDSAASVESTPKATEPSVQKRDKAKISSDMDEPFTQTDRYMEDPDQEQKDRLRHEKEQKPEEPKQPNDDLERRVDALFQEKAEFRVGQQFLTTNSDGGAEELSITTIDPESGKIHIKFNSGEEDDLSKDQIRELLDRKDWSVKEQPEVKDEKEVSTTSEQTPTDEIPKVKFTMHQPIKYMDLEGEILKLTDWSIIMKLNNGVTREISREQALNDLEKGGKFQLRTSEPNTPDQS